jgi:hypothetical protein
MNREPIRDLIAYLNGKVIMDPVDRGDIRQLNDLAGLVRILEMVR